MEFDVKETGKYIRQYRKIAGLTQEELAQKVGISTMSIRRYENGERMAARETIETIAQVLDVDPYSLYSFDQATAALEDDINDGIKHKARVIEIMDKITPEGVRIGKDVFEAIAGNPKYQMYFSSVPAANIELERMATPTPPEGKDTTPPADAPETPPEGE